MGCRILRILCLPTQCFSERSDRFRTLPGTIVYCISSFGVIRDIFLSIKRIIPIENVTHVLETVTYRSLQDVVVRASGRFPDTQFFLSKAPAMPYVLGRDLYRLLP